MNNEFKLVPVEQLEFFANDLALHGVGDIESARMIEDILAEPHQPTASGAEPEVLMSVRAVLGGLNGLCYETIKFLAAPTVHGKTLELIDRAHLAPLQAEIERLTAAQMEMAELYFLRGKEIDQLKARCDEMEAERVKASDFLLHIKKCLRRNGEYSPLSHQELDELIGHNSSNDCQCRWCALSKPAGSEKV